MSLTPPPRINPPTRLERSQESLHVSNEELGSSKALSPQINAQPLPRLKEPNAAGEKTSKFSLLTFLLVVLMGGMTCAYVYQDRIVTYYQNAGVLAPDAVAQETLQGDNIQASIEGPIIDAPTSPYERVGIGGDLTEEEILSRMGTEGMKINYTSDPTYNCGLIGADLSKIDWYVGGCYTLEYENTLTLYYGAETDYDMRYFVLLHEYGHYQQGQEGFLSSPLYNVADGEADADCRSINMGATSDQVTCKIEGWTPTWLKTKYAIE